MPDNDINKPSEKFFFHLHDFGVDAPKEEDLEPEEPPPPPPPTFNEEELEVAKTQAFNDGKKEGVKESDAAKLKSIQNSVSSLQASIQDLILNEGDRQKTYEIEAINLSNAIFNQLFPLYSEENSLNELKEAIKSTLHAQKEIETIEIWCNPSEKSDLEAHFNAETSIEELTFVEKDSIPAGNCEIRWKDGGATHNPKDIAEKIALLLEGTLEENGIKRHDDTVNGDDLAEGCDIVEDSEPSENNETGSDDGDNA